jgi:hypothetical protein
VNADEEAAAHDLSMDEAIARKVKEHMALLDAVRDGRTLVPCPTCGEPVYEGGQNRCPDA